MDKYNHHAWPSEGPRASIHRASRPWNAGIASPDQYACFIPTSGNGFNQKEGGSIWVTGTRSPSPDGMKKPRSARNF